MEIDNFEYNEDPDELLKEMVHKDILPVNYHLKQADAFRDLKGELGQASAAGSVSGLSFISDVSNLTEKEQRVDAERQKLLDREEQIKKTLNLDIKRKMATMKGFNKNNSDADMNLELGPSFADQVNAAQDPKEVKKS